MGFESSNGLHAEEHIITNVCVHSDNGAASPSHPWTYSIGMRGIGGGSFRGHLLIPCGRRGARLSCSLEGRPCWRFLLWIAGALELLHCLLSAAHSLPRRSCCISVVHVCATALPTITVVAGGEHVSCPARAGGRDENVEFLDLPERRLQGRYDCGDGVEAAPRTIVLVSCDTSGSV